MPHPLLQRHDVIDQNTTAYTAVFHESLMELMKDHTIGGRTILPGAGFVEMALAATVAEHESRIGGGGALTCDSVELEDISFLEPFTLPIHGGMSDNEQTSTKHLCKLDV